MKRMIGLLVALAIIMANTPTHACNEYHDFQYSWLKMRLSTRSGPGTEYDEPGTFFSNSWQNELVRVMGKHWDGNIWWVLVDFSDNNSSYRVWTGLKRVDVNIDDIPEVYSIGQGTVNSTASKRGPGRNYANGPQINHWQDVVAYGWENGYVEVEYYDQGKVYRVWVPESAVSIDSYIPGTDGIYYNLIP